ncbi:MAG: carboxypeptidase-like regulatory domain-containing protein [Flavobacteriales bacterium]|jgi:hypothetical protein|nr:carboxypeptidase-like regulatory domain-containing protein [Flavobacteriales bacterium]
MRAVLTTIVFLMGFVYMASAQVTVGTISGKVYDEDSTTIIPFATVWVETEGGKIGTTADIDGRYKIEALKPGVYNLHAKTVIKGEKVVDAVKVDPDAITTVDLIMDNANTLTVVHIDYTAVKIEKDIPKVRLLAEDIQHSPNIRNPKLMMANSTTDIQMMEGSSDVIIRGSRPGDVIYYIDGVKTQDLNGVPGAAIGSMEAYTGGIPAKYGDTTGGVIALETKSYFDLYYAWKAKQ